MAGRRNVNEQAEKQQKMINKLICNYITEKFLTPPTDAENKEISQNDYANLIDISSSVLTKMKKDGGYEIPLATIYSICEKENISLSEFFRHFEEMFPEVKIQK